MTLENSHDISIRFLLCLARVNDGRGWGSGRYNDTKRCSSHTHTTIPLFFHLPIPTEYTAAPKTTRLVSRTWLMVYYRTCYSSHPHILYHCGLSFRSTVTSLRCALTRSAVIYLSTKREKARHERDEWVL